MAVVSKMLFPTAVPNESEPEEPRPARDPLAPFEPRSLRVPAGSEMLFPALDASSDLGRKRKRALAQKREQELAHKVAETMAAAQKQGQEQGYEEGLARGQAEGLEQGRAAAAEELEQLRGSLQEILASLTGARQEMAASLDTDLAEIVLVLSGQLAGGALSAEPERVLELARGGLNLLAESDAVTIRASSEYATLLRDEQEALATSINVTALRIVEDPSLGPDGCLVESELGRVDLRIAQRLEAARDLLSTVRNED